MSVSLEVKNVDKDSYQLTLQFHLGNVITFVSQSLWLPALKEIL